MIHFSLFHFSTPYSDTAVALPECAKEKKWERVIEILEKYPDYQRYYLKELLDMAWNQKHLSGYLGCLKMYNQLYNITYPELCERQKRIFAEASQNRWYGRSLYNPGTERRLRDSNGMRLIDYAHFYNKTSFFNEKHKKQEIHIRPRSENSVLVSFPNYRDKTYGRDSFRRCDSTPLPELSRSKRQSYSRTRP